MHAEENKQPSMIERIERALVLLAYFIELDGDVHVPMYEKFEEELTVLRQRENTKARARRLLQAYSDVSALRNVAPDQVSFQDKPISINISRPDLRAS
jgi:hypothetical protein